MLEVLRRGYVVARVLDERVDFHIDDGSLLAGCRLEPWLEVPRTLDADGRSGATSLPSVSGRENPRKLGVGDRVQLTSRRP